MATTIPHPHCPPVDPQSLYPPVDSGAHHYMPVNPSQPAYPVPAYAPYPSGQLNQPQYFYAPSYPQPPVIYIQPPPAPVVSRQVVILNRCPHGNHQLDTRREMEIGATTWIACTCLLMMGLFPLNYIPFCIDQCKDPYYVCSTCNRRV